MKPYILAVLSVLSVLSAISETVVNRGYVVQVAEDGLTTIPPNTIATPGQVDQLTAAADSTLNVSTGLAAVVESLQRRVTLYSTNYVVTSTVYVQSVGGVPYDPSNQTIKVHSFIVSETNIVIIGTLKQLPLVPPKLDWRQALEAGGWSNVNATVSTVDIPAGVTNAAAAYSFTLSKPAGGTAYFRIVDNSSGASGSGLFWIVFGAIYVDGKKGFTGPITNVVGSVTNVYNFQGGACVEPTPLGGM